MKKLYFIILFFLAVLGTSAKGKKKVVIKKPVLSTEQIAQQENFEEMLPSTAQLMFIDSVVVDKADFLKHIPFSPDMGRLVQSEGTHGYINEFDDTEVFAHGDSAKNDRNLFLAHRYGKDWNEASELTELRGSFTWMDMPFLMSDGVTLYFSAKGGEESLGGLDLYKANYNADESRFFEPSNLGLPYNSSANDYFLAESDFYNLGILVSDRYQPAGKVCIYIFQPTDQRVIFPEGTPEEELKSQALLKDIKATWGFGDRDAAMKRLSSMKEQKTAGTAEKIRFVVNDKKVYSSVDQFRSADSKKKFQKLQSLQKQYNTNVQLLDGSRKTYSELPKTKRQNTAEQIKQLEKQQMSLQEQILTLEKSIRQAEQNNR